jgi:hypothetical protein
MKNSYSKLRNSKLVSEKFEMQGYIKTMNLVDARTNFRMRCSITNNIKLNQRSNPVYAILCMLNSFGLVMSVAMWIVKATSCGVRAMPHSERD